MIDRVCISLSSKCQLHCSYCHFDTRIDKKQIKEINETDALKIITNIYQYASANHKTIKVGLVGSGEPLIRFELIKAIVNTTKEIDPENLLNFYTISNGIYFNENICKWFFDNRHLIKLCFSLDGNRKIHDFCRKTIKGKGSFTDVMKAVKIYKGVFLNAPPINATVHKETLRNAKEVLDFFEKNFREITFSRLVDITSPQLFISKQDYTKFMELAKNRNLSLRQFKTKKYDCTMYGQLCGVGRTNIYFDNEKVYPCARFVGNSKYELGNSTDSIESIEKYMTKTITPCVDGLCFFDTNRSII